ncbi:hypothetical protein CCHL11_09266 [Colletotrichum chlorophyti]|uniref:Uncharacterized protein n=1 Tax=Colletotrichum chlorophyti TaxID=708187 RepID=A0A1Q8RCX1_9PEZI|nr:hypothetical protein CCHL11_09266 [Colletotrichum chlorophyti]
MAQSTEPRRRFAPVPIETTFDSVRQKAGEQHHHQQQSQQQQLHHQPGPAPEPTPEHTPRTPSPNPFEQQMQFSQSHQQPPRRRFAPQLIETSRRARRVGDTGPATRPADKTDITPYTNHIYRTKSRRKVADGASSPVRQPTQPAPSQIQRQPKGARRESEDENAGRYMLEWAAMEADRQMQEAALAAFPNSRPREGGAAHFYFRESSGDDSTPESISPEPTGTQGKPRGRHAHAPRRKSSELGYWHKHMQAHAEKLAVARGEHVPVFDDDDEDTHNDSEIDRMELEGPPDPMWLTNNKRNHTTELKPIGESFMPLIAPDPIITNDARGPNLPAPEPAPKPIGEAPMPLVPPTAASKPAQVPVAAPAQVVPETGFRNAAAGGGFGRPFGNFGLPAETAEFRKMRKAASPPMLGKDLVFRKCPSPKHTKLEPDHPFSEVPTAEERNRDDTGEVGLWRGYCFRKSESDQAIVPASLQGPRMLHTPLPPSTSADPFAAAFGKSSVTDEPGSHYSSATLTPNTAEHRVRSGGAKGLHMLHGLEDRLKREKALEDKIASEFDDTFITQVYNYLSLGYPAMARAFDEELSKISHMSIEELEMDDAKQMAAGHMMEPAEAEMAEENRCPRWKALKAYIYEWARQHPDLDSLDSLAWGVRERRGSWAI